MLFLFSGCISGCSLCEFGDAFADRGVDHCYQWAAVKEGDPEGCEKIPGTGFTGQNPPRDRCYIKIASKEGDPSLCDRTTGGMNGYDKYDCYDQMVSDGNTADACDGQPNEAACRANLANAGMAPSKDCGTGWIWSDGSCTKAAPDDASPSTTGEEPPPSAGGTTGSGGPSASEEIVDDGTDDSADDSKDDNKDDETAAVGASDEDGTGDGEKNGEDSDGTDGEAGTDTSADAERTDDADETGDEDAEADDRAAAAAIDTLSEITQKIDETGEAINKVPETIGEAVENLFSATDKTPKSGEEEKQTRLSELVADMEGDERSEVISAFVKERERRDEMTIEEQRELIQEIRDEYEFGQLMDEKANTLRAETTDKLTAKVDELVEEKKQGAWDWFKEKTYGWVKGRTPEQYQEAAELAEQRYNKAIEKYNSALDSYNKGKDYFDRAKKAYDEVKQVMDNVRRLQEKVKSGRISQGRADAIKGGVLLGKGLEHVTKYIPVFGETASEITAGTFQATMKFAEKRAERTTRLDACIEDPMNCDPNGISPY